MLNLQAVLLARGWDVHVFEHAGAELAGRGAGIITHPALFDCLDCSGVSIDESFGVDIHGRVTFDRSGAEIATLPLRQNLTTWGRLHQRLREVFPRSRYHFGHSFRQLEQDAGGVTARFANGATSSRASRSASRRASRC